jgi:LPS export ABC transporter protein LptC
MLPALPCVRLSVKRTSALILVIGLSIALLVTGSYFILKESEQISVPVLLQPTSGNRQLMNMDTFRFVRSEKGLVTVRLDAAKAELYDNKEAHLMDVEILFVDSDTREAKITGDSGNMDTTTGNASLRRVARDVKIITSDDYLLTTASLFWKAGERIVRTADPFKLIGNEIYLEGVGLTANADLGTLAVKDNVKAVLQE